MTIKIFNLTLFLRLTSFIVCFFAMTDPLFAIETRELENVLTDEEKAWIKTHSIIKTGGEIDWSPFDFVNDKGE